MLTTPDPPSRAKPVDGRYPNAGVSGGTLRVRLARRPRRRGTRKAGRPARRAGGYPQSGSAARPEGARRRSPPQITVGDRLHATTRDKDDFGSAHLQIADFAATYRQPWASPGQLLGKKVICAGPFTQTPKQ